MLSVTSSQGINLLRKIINAVNQENHKWPTTKKIQVKITRVRSCVHENNKKVYFWGGFFMVHALSCLLLSSLLWSSNMSQAEAAELKCSLNCIFAYIFQVMLTCMHILCTWWNNGEEVRIYFLKWYMFINKQGKEADKDKSWKKIQWNILMMMRWYSHLAHTPSHCHHIQKKVVIIYGMCLIVIFMVVIGRLAARFLAKVKNWIGPHPISL